jgi:hypothetical protein
MIFGTRFVILSKRPRNWLKLYYGVVELVYKFINLTYSRYQSQNCALCIRCNSSSDRRSLLFVCLNVSKCILHIIHNRQITPTCITKGVQPVAVAVISS